MMGIVTQSGFRRHVVVVNDKSKVIRSGGGVGQNAVLVGGGEFGCDDVAGGAVGVCGVERIGEAGEKKHKCLERCCSVLNSSVE